MSIELHPCSEAASKSVARSGGCTLRSSGEVTSSFSCLPGSRREVLRKADPGLRRVLGVNSIDNFRGPVSGRGPSDFWSFETYLNLECPSTEFGPELGPVSCPVLCLKFIKSIELTPWGTIQ